MAIIPPDQFDQNQRVMRQRNTGTDIEGFIPDAAQGFLAGVAQGFLVPQLFRLTGDDEYADMIDRTAQESPIASTAGEIAALFVPYGAAFKAGKFAGRAGLKALGKSLGGPTQKLALESSLGLNKLAGLGPLARTRERIARAGVLEEMRDIETLLLATGERFTPRKALQAGLFQQRHLDALKTLGFRLDEPLTNRLSQAGLGGLLGSTRTAEIIGANAGISAFAFAHEGTKALIEGDDLGGAAQLAALSFVFGAGFEGGLSFIGRLERLNIPFDERVISKLPKGAQEYFARREGRVLNVNNPLNFSKRAKSKPEIEAAQKALYAGERQVTTVQNRGPRGGFAPGTHQVFGPRQGGGARELVHGPETANKTSLVTKSSLVEVRERIDLATAELNRLLGLPSASLAPGRTKRLTKGKLTARDARGISDLESFTEVTGTHFAHKRRPITGVADTEEHKTAVETIRFLNAAKLEEERIATMVANNPLTPYFDAAPAVSGKLELAGMKLAQQVFGSPSAIAKRLGPTGTSFIQQLGQVEQAKNRVLEVSTIRFSELENRAAKVLGLGKKDLTAAVGNKQLLMFDSLFDRFGSNSQEVLLANGRGSGKFVQAGKASANFIKLVKREVKHSSGRKLRNDEIEELYDIWFQRWKIHNEGISETLAVKGGATPQNMKLARGFDDLYMLDRSVRKVSDQTLAEHMKDRIVLQKDGSVSVFPHPGAAELAPMWSPHTVLALGGSELESMFLKKFPSKYLRSKGIQRADGRVRLFANIDKTREIPGTLQEKLAAGLPYEANPFRASVKYMTMLNERIERGTRFGFTQGQQNAVRDRFVRAVASENRRIPVVGGVRVPDREVGGVMHDMFNATIGRNWEEEAYRRLTTVLTSWNVASKLTFGALPNMFQSTQTASLFGMKHTFDGFRQAVRGEKNTVIARAMGSAEQVVDSMGLAHGDGLFPDQSIGSLMANIFRKVANGSLKVTGFKFTEATNRQTAGTAALEFSIDMVFKAAGMNSAGKHMLRGNQLENARRRAASLGYSLDDIALLVRNGGTTNVNGKTVPNWLMTDDGAAWAQSVMFKGMELTQFVPNATMRPLFWDTPVGRVMFQFKTFAFQQSRFLKDQLLGELAAGNPLPAMYFLGIAAPAGEIVGDVKNLIRVQAGGKERREPDNPFERFVFNTLNVGGAGILSDMWYAARREQFAESILGPTASDVIGMYEQLARGNTDGFFRDISRQPAAMASRAFIRTIGDIGWPTVEWMDEQIDVFGDSNDGPIGTKSAGTLLLNDSKRK